MSQFRRFLYCIAAVGLLLMPLASQAFIVKKIDVYGLQRVNRGALARYITVKPGQHYTSRTGSSLLQSLYKSGFFSNVTLGRRGNVLVISVRESPTIGQINVTGNKEITNKQLKPVLKALSIQIGGVLNPFKLNQLKVSLQQQYQNLGYYAATVSVDYKKESRNRVSVQIKVKEGPVATINSINIVGNNAFSHWRLMRQFQLSTWGLFTFLTHSNRYSPMKLQQDLQKLANFYLNHGYLRFRIVSKKVDISNDNSEVNITIKINEGSVFRIGTTKIVGKEAKNPALQAYMTLQPGSVFSRQAVIAVDKNIVNYFRDKGYAMPMVAVKTQLDVANKKINLMFNVDPRQRVYVRRITFEGNSHTQDSVLRGVTRQMEGSVYSQKQIDESKRQLMLLAYFKNVQVQTKPVGAKPDEVDLNYKVTEVPAGQFGVKVGYGDLYKFFYGANLYQQNFMGTGKAAGISFMNSQYSMQYGLTYSDPMYTLDGISRSISLNYTHTTPSNVGLTNYTMDNAGFTLSYGIPISEFNKISLGFGYSNIQIKNFDPKIGSPSITDFLGRYGTIYNQFTVNLGWSHDTRDRSPFPTNGGMQSLGVEFGVPVAAHNSGKPGYKFLSLGYYKVNAMGQWYCPLGDSDFILSPHFMLGFGDGLSSFRSLPFFENYYGGGITTLPGFEANSLGPKNPNDDTEALGGNLQMFAGVNLILPNFLSDSVRTALFVAAGNVFQTEHLSDKVHYESLSLNNIRASTGFLLAWNIPLLGALEFSISKTLHSRPGDNTSLIGFTVGSLI